MTNIIRKQNGNFTVVRNALVNDERLSLEAIGLLTWLLSKPDNWKIIQSHIAKTFNLGRDKVRKLINELIECRYLHKSTVRNEGGEFNGVTYILYDVPPETHLPSPDYPASVQPTSVNQALVNTESKQSLRSSEDVDNKRGSRVPEDFSPDERAVELATSLGLSPQNFQTQFDAFMDYWRAVPGAKGRKLDWQGTFRNWLRNSKKFDHAKPSPKQPARRSILEQFFND